MSNSTKRSTTAQKIKVVGPVQIWWHSMRGQYTIHISKFQVIWIEIVGAAHL